MFLNETTITFDYSNENRSNVHAVNSEKSIYKTIERLILKLKITKLV